MSQTAPTDSASIYCRSKPVKWGLAKKYAEILKAGLPGGSAEVAEKTPAPKGNKTRGIFSLRDILRAWTGPEPPKATMVQLR